MIGSLLRLTTTGLPRERQQAGHGIKEWTTRGYLSKAYCLVVSLYSLIDVL